MIRSEHTQIFTEDELKVLQSDIQCMTEEELIEFRNSFDSDTMGFIGKEAM